MKTTGLKPNNGVVYAVRHINVTAKDIARIMINALFFAVCFSWRYS